jgi:outer membrane protein assembly factor BamB
MRTYVGVQIVAVLVSCGDSSGSSGHELERVASSGGAERETRERETREREPRVEAVVAPVDPGEDVLAEVRAANSPPNGVPPREFRAGHVTPRTLDASAIQRTSGGFRVQLPSGAPVVTPTVHDGLVITSGGFHSRELYAFHAKSGEVAWALSLGDDGPSASACERDVCVINTESCTIFAVDARSGRMLWSLWLGDPLMSAPSIAGDLVFTSFPAAGGPAGYTHALGAFDLRTGEVRWTKWIDSDVMSAPVIDGGKLYAASFAGTMYELRPETGELVAAHRARATSAPVVADGELTYSRRTDAQGSASAREGIVRGRQVAAEREASWLDHRVQSQSGYAQQGQQLDSLNGFGGGAPANANANAAVANIGRGSVSTLQAFQGSRPLHHGDSLYSTLGDRIVSTDARTGRENWNVPVGGDLAQTGGALATAPARAGTKLFVATYAGQILMIDPGTGRIARRFDAGAPIRSQPVIADGWIYVGTENGQLVGIDTGDRSLTGWTSWGGNAQRDGKPE